MKYTIAFLLIPFFAHAGGSTTVGPQNPASVYCQNEGGSFSIKNRDGQYGICNLGRAAIEEWTLYRHNHGTAVMATEAFLAHPQRQPVPLDPNGFLRQPAAAYCEQLGGVEISLTDIQGEAGYCGFNDGSMIDSWTLFYGPQDPANAALTNLLKM